ncbi:unnamed protein product [Ectocarpus sp. 6 AP-2014]
MDMRHIHKSMAQKVEAPKQSAKARSREGRSTQNGREEHTFSDAHTTPHVISCTWLFSLISPQSSRWYGSAGRTTTSNGCVTMANGEYSQKTTLQNVTAFTTSSIHPFVIYKSWVV